MYVDHTSSVLINILRHEQNHGNLLNVHESSSLNENNVKETELKSHSMVWSIKILNIFGTRSTN